MITSRSFLSEALPRLGRALARACLWRHGGAVTTGKERGRSPVIPALLALLALVGAVPDADAAFPNGYSYRRLIDLTDAQVSGGPHTNFPVLISLTLADLRTTGNGGKVTDAQGDDIIFTASDGTTQLAHEVETYVTTTGELVAWVRVPSLAATSTLYIYYGNSGVTTFQGNVTSNGVTGVWDANYLGVWHLKENPAGTAPQMKDSTSNAKHGTSFGSMTSGNQVTGKVNGSLTFDGTDDRIQLGSIIGDRSAFTISLWFKHTSTGSPQKMYGEGNTGTITPIINISSNEGGTGAVRFEIRDDANAVGSVTKTSSHNDGAWHHLVAVQSSKSSRTLYVDGVSAGTDTTTIGAITLNTGNIAAINRTSVQYFYPGGVDEARISNIARSGGWILTEYNNQSAPSGFSSIGSEEAGPTGTAIRYRSIGVAADVVNDGTISITSGSTVVTKSGGTSWVTANRGQGDRLTVDGNHYIILSVDSANQLTLTSAALTTYSGGTYTIARQFTTLQQWANCVVRSGSLPCSRTPGSAPEYFASTSTNLVADDRREVGVAYNDGAAFSAVQFNTSVTTDATHDITLTVAAGNRHTGVAGTGVVLNNTAATTAITSTQALHLTVEWLELMGSGSGAAENGMEFSSAATLVIRNNIIHHVDEGVRITNNGASADVTNNFVYLTGNDGINFNNTGLTGTMRFLNNTVYAPGDFGIRVAGISGGTAIVRNNIALACVDSCYSLHASTTSSNNISGDATGSAGLINLSATADPNTCGDPDGCVGFQALGATPNLHLIATTYANKAVDSGADLSAFLTGDIDGEARPGGSAWDIGADEFPGGGPGAATLSSAANQTFVVGQAAAAASTLTITDASTPTITAAQDLRIRIPAALNMTWDTSVTTVTLGGGAAGKVSATGVTYEDSNKTAVLNVTTSFAASDQVTVSGLNFANFTAVSAASNLQLVVAGSGGATAATDDKTKTIAAAATLSAAANQTFAVGQASTTASTLTVTDSSTPTITTLNDIRIRIPAALNMVWDTSVTSITPGGGASGKVAATGVYYEDGNKTVVINVTTNFAASDVLTIAGLTFANFTAVSSANNLQLVVAGSGGATAATDDKTVTIVAATSAALSSAANQTFTVGQASTTASTLTVTDSSAASITAAQDLRIRIPAGFNMTWDTTVTDFTPGGGAAGKVSATGVTYEDSNRTAVINVTSNFAVSDVLTVAGLKFTNFTAVSSASNLQLVVAGSGGATAATDDKTKTIAASATLSSAANQTFAVGEASATASTLTVTDSSAASITAAQDIRIRIPAGLNMIWDTSVTTVTLGGGAAGKVSSTVTYEDGNKTAVLNVTTNFAGSDQVTVSGLNFTSFTAVSAANNLELVVAGAGGATAATDDKTKAIAASATLSSAANQTFAVGQGSTTASTLTVTDSSAASITSSQDIRIRIPSGLNMIWDTSVTTVTPGGGAAGKVSSTVTYEDSDKTVRINVTSDFAASEQVTIAGLKFLNFTAVSAANNLQLVVAGSGGATAATDDKTITIVAGGTLTLSSAVNQTFTVGQAAATASTLTITEGPTPTITAANDIRIRIPDALNMVWDSSVTTVTPGGGAAGKVTLTVTYEDSNKTVRINVTSNFAAGDQVTIAGLKFTNFTAASVANNLQLVVAGAGGATAAIDDKTISIAAAADITAEQSVSACVAPGGGGAITFDAASVQAGSASGSTSLTWSHTVTSAGSDRILIVGVGVDQNQTCCATVTGVTYGGVSMTLVPGGTSTRSGATRSELWYLLNPPAGANNVVVTLSGSADVRAGATSYTGVNQSTPFGTAASATGDSSTASVNVSSAAGELVVDHASLESTSAYFTVGAGQTLRYASHGSDGSGGSNNNAPIGGSSEPGAATVTMSWSLSSGKDWAIVAVPLKPASASTTSLTLPSWTPQSGELLLLGVTWRNKVARTVSGNGLTWTLVAERDNDRVPSIGVALYRASGTSPTAGPITISLPGNTQPVYAAAVRLSGVDTTVNQGIEASATASGPAAADDSNMKVTVTTVTANAMALAWGGQRGSATLSLPAGETVIVQSSADCGTSGERMRGHMWQETVATPGPTELGQDNSLSSAHPWAAIGVSIKPSAGAPPGPAAVSSATNQVFTIGQASTTASTLTITDSTAATITAAQDIRIRIPAALNMIWDASVTTVTLGGGAAGKVNASGVTYEDGNKTAVLNVATDFANSDQVTIAGLKFTNFTAASAANNLQLVVAGAGGATASTDDKTKTIVTSVTLSSAANQTFTVGQASTTASTLTVTDSSIPTITSSNEIRIRIPAALNMTWDTSVTSITRGGSASGKVSSTVTYEDSNKTVRINVTTSFAGNDQLTVDGLKFTNFTAASSANNLQLVVTGSGGATAGTDDKTKTIITLAALSSAANQIFTVGQGSTTASTLTVTDSSSPTITAGQDIRIRIPAALNMTWDATVTTVSLGGGAAARVSATGVAYEDSNKMVVINVTSDFTGSDQVTIAGLKFTNFTAASSASNLQLVVTGSGGATAASDDKIISIVPPGTVALSSAADQTFTVGQVSTAAITLTVTDAPTPVITTTQEIRIRIPAALNMTWDPAVTSITLGGGAAGKVSATGVTYEDSNKTAVLNVTTNFAALDQVTVSGLKFTNFTAVSPADNLELVVVGAGGATAATDDKTIQIISVATLSSAANQTFMVGQAATTASTLTVTDSSTPTITSSQNLRIRIPDSLNMVWDTSVGSITRGGSASGKVSSSVNYEDSGKTVRISVNTNFAAGDVLTIAGLKFTSFTAVSAHNLQLVVSGSGGATAAVDDKTVTIIGAGVTNQEVVSTCAGVGTVTVAASATVASRSGGSSLTFSHTTPSGSNRLLVVGVSVNNDNRSVTGVTYNGVALTRAGTRSNDDDATAEIWYLVNPPVTTADVVVSLSGSIGSSYGFVAAALPLNGVDQSTPVGTFQSSTGDSSSASLNVTSSSSGDFVLAVYASEQGSNSGSCTQGSGQTEYWDTRGGSSGTTQLGCGMSKPGGGTVSFSISNSNSDHWAMGAVPIKSAPTVPTSLVLPSWTPQPGELLLVGVALRDETIVPSVSGNGLTWTQVTERDHTEVGVNLYRASGASPTAGSITIDLPGNTLPAYATAVRLSNVDTAVNQGIEAVASASSNNNDIKVSVTTLSAWATALAWGGQQGTATLSLPAGETMIDETGAAGCGASPNQIRGHMWQELVPTPAATQLGQDNDLSSSRPWAAIAVSIKPIPPVGPQPAGRFNAFEPTTVAGALTGVIRTKIAGNTISLDIAALNSQRTAIDTAFTGTVKVEVLNASSGSPGTNGCNASWPVIQTLTNPTFSAGDNGRKAISFTVANSYPNVRLRISYPTSSPTQIGCSNDNFAIRPSALFGFTVSDNDWQTAGTGRALTSTAFDSVTHKAGRPMSVRASAVTASGTTVATNYTGTPTQWVSGCAGAACTTGFGTLSLTSAFTAGQLASDVASYNDVGSFALQLVDSNYASVDTYDTVGDCSAGGSYVCTPTINVGRFVPNHFSVSLNTPAFTAACNAFTYLGQKFNYATAPEITVTARNFANSTTSRYTGSLWRITSASLTGKAYTTASGTLDTSGAPGTDPVISDTGGGAGKLVFSSGTGFQFPRGTPEAPFDAEISLAINVIDADGVAYASNPARFGQASAGSGIAFNSGKPMRFGRLAMRNAHGSQLLPMLVPVEAQYWTGTAFITNTLDSCSTIMSTDYAMGTYTGSLTDSPTCETAISGGGTLSAGRGTLILAAPGAGNDGSVILTPNLGAAATGSTCTTVGAAPVSATSANLPHLQGNWAGGAYDANPTARATFGVYKGSEEVIFMRENF
jgi:hypothetical protein